MSLTRNVDLLRRLPKLDGLRFAAFGRSADAASPLQEVTSFGDNPGALRMFAFVPAQLQKPRALVVVLHGCGQTAAGYDLGAGWSTLAGHYGFALLMPEQQRTNNANTCFNWFNPEDTARGGGEAHSIREMIAHMAEAHRIDPQRVFITGLSAGGGMTSVMLATYPEVFAAGAVIAGLPYGIASNLREALDGMFHSPARPARELGDLVRNASDHRGPWPKISVWHGSADRTVNPGNANEIVKQWLDLHDLPEAPMAETNVDGYPRQTWWNKDGETLVESYAITDMAHGTPLGLADNDQRYGVEGAFLIEAGISSSYHIAKFFGLTDWIADVAKVEAKAATKAATKPATKQALSPAPHLARSIRAAVAEQPAEPKREETGGFDIGQIITRALTAAGLMK
ncbi:PHB depolymerase family esterase [Bradyrhizobium sp. 199]|uniref:extracellular catalytic domain type 1 short-chain-length polyhydroxyalkanoate depolymerase n=1 Tax=Bradyrhizobium sp. 199 TaxID=2782664 RepID=UPI001FFB9D0E|nr:PHB depolymerase family esterase [Bradyrhizobium sp. 199]